MPTPPNLPELREYVTESVFKLREIQEDIDFLATSNMSSPEYDARNQVAMIALLEEQDDLRLEYERVCDKYGEVLKNAKQS